MQSEFYTQDTPMAIPPRDPREQAVVIRYPRPAPPETDDSVSSARFAAEQERHRVVVDVARTNPRMALQLIIDMYPDAIGVIDKFIGACEECGYATMARTFTRLLAEPRR